MSEGRWIDVGGAAKLLRVSTHTVHRYLRDGRLKGSRRLSERIIQIPLRAVEELLRKSGNWLDGADADDRSDGRSTAQRPAAKRHKRGT